jgi:hypothetical protein
MAQDSQSLNYLKKSLTTSYLQQQMQNPAKAPAQSSGGQSGTAGNSQSGSTSNQK